MNNALLGIALVLASLLLAALFGVIAKTEGIRVAVLVAAAACAAVATTALVVYAAQLITG